MKLSGYFIILINPIFIILLTDYELNNSAISCDRWWKENVVRLIYN